MTAFHPYVRKHFFGIERSASLLGFAGLGYLVLQNLRCGLYVAFLLVYLMALAKIYLNFAAGGIAFVPRGKSAAYMAAWWALALPIALLALSTPILMILMIVLCYR